MPLQLKSLLAPQTSLLSRSLNNKIIMSLFPRVKQKCTGSAGRCWDRSCWLLFMCTNLRNCSLKLKLKSPQIFLQSRLQYFPKPIAKSADSDVHFISFQNLHWTEFFTNRSRSQNPPPPPLPLLSLNTHTQNCEIYWLCSRDTVSELLLPVSVFPAVCALLPEGCVEYYVEKDTHPLWWKGKWRDNCVHLIAQSNLHWNFLVINFLIFFFLMLQTNPALKQNYMGRYTYITIQSNRKCHQHRITSWDELCSAHYVLERRHFYRKINIMIDRTKSRKWTSPVK